MKAAAFDYCRPDSVADAIARLAEMDGAALPIAGGQSLLALMSLRLTMIEQIVDISRLAELREIHDTTDHVFIGAMTTHAAIEDGKVPDPSAGLLARVAGKIAYRAVRNRGTIGGSVSLADPAADWPACLMALDAEVIIAGTDGKRAQPVTDFITGAYETTLSGGEIVLGFRIPRRPALRWGTSKVSRKSGAFSDSLAVVVVSGDETRIALAGTSSRACLLTHAATYAGANPVIDAAALRAAVLSDLDEVAPDADAYQRRCHIATVMRAVRDARQ